MLLRLLAAVLDEDGARVAGVPIGALNAVVAALAALTVALSMRIVGVLLIAALMVLPVAAAARVAWSLHSTLALGIGIGFFSSLAGLVLAYYADTPPGGTIVLVAAARSPTSPARRPCAGRGDLRTLSHMSGEAAEIVFDHVTKRYPGRPEPAVDDLTLTVPAGEICVLVGPSGGGKTSAMKMVNRLIDMTSGDIQIGGRSVRTFEPTELRRQIGYVIQQTGLSLI